MPAAGTITSIFIFVLGLTEQELLKAPIVFFEIKGLYVGGKGVNVGVQQCGMILFMRGENAKDKKRYQIYRDQIRLSFVTWTRSEGGKR